MFMDFGFIFKCYIIGILGATGLGPIFVLTFNRGATKGFWAGFVTALGAAAADSLFFFLGLAGALAFIGESARVISVLDVFGGLLLFFLGYNSIKKVRKFEVQDGEKRKSFLLLASKAFLLTVINPLVLLFFMIISVQVLPNGVKTLTLFQYGISSFMVFLGSGTILTAVAAAGFLLGKGISYKRLKFLSLISGIVFIIAGIYLWSEFFINIIKIYQS
ncbi:MAG: LysE family transporter [bacterium]